MTSRERAIEVRRAAPDRLSALARLFGSAFADEPTMRWPMGEHGDVVERYTRCFGYFLEAALGDGIVWEVPERQGAAVWVPPDHSATWENSPWNQARISSLTDDEGGRWAAFWQWVEAHTPDEPLWLLDALAVEPAVRGRGVGTALIESGLAQARSGGLGAFLCTGTRRNVSTYTRCGFRVTEDVDAPDGGPHVWFMRWDP